MSAYFFIWGIAWFALSLPVILWYYVANRSHSEKVELEDLPRAFCSSCHQPVARGKVLCLGCISKYSFHMGDKGRKV